jgi:hypothetical protein
VQLKYFSECLKIYIIGKISMVALFRLFDGAPNLSVVDPHPINKTSLNDL